MMPDYRNQLPLLLDTKVCRVCKTPKSLNEFAVAAGCRDGKRGECKDCRRALERQYHRDQPERFKNRPSRRPEYKRAVQLRIKYGLREGDYEALLLSQEGLCAVCRQPQRWRKEPLSVDHDHASGRVRGLLCHPCNLLIGYGDDDPSILVAAARYIEASRVEVRQDEIEEKREEAEDA